MPKYRLRRRSGSEFTLECHEDLLRKRRVRGRGPINVGDRFRFDGKLDEPHFTAELVSLKVKVVPSVLATWGRGFRSDAMGINPDQRMEAVAADQAQGLRGVDYDEKTGEAIFSSRGAYKRYCEAHGFFDRNSGYSGAKKRDSREREILGLPQLVQPEPGAGINAPIFVNDRGEPVPCPL